MKTPPPDERNYNDDSCTVWTVCGMFAAIMAAAFIIVALVK